VNISGQSEVARKLSPAPRTVLDLLASVKFAVGLIIIIVAACVVGTILPQGSEATDFVQRNPQAAHRFAFFNSLGLTHVFSARWFIALLCVLATTVAVCSTRRLVTIKRASGFARRRALGSMFTHISILLILGGAVARGIWGEKGYVALRHGETVSFFEGTRGLKPLPFALQLAKFEIETEATTPREDAFSNNENLPPEVTIKNFRSTIDLICNGSVVDRRTLTVNSPLTFKGYTFYQTGYNPDDLSWTSLQIVRDPGVPLVYSGFGFLVGGLFTVFYLNPWLTAREAKV
jgi:cytochrome c biogenesis protein ResB